MVVVVRLRLRGAHVVDERVEHVGHVLERRHVQHGQLLRVLRAVRAQQRQAVREELATGAARFYAYSRKKNILLIQDSDLATLSSCITTAQNYELNSDF